MNRIFIVGLIFLVFGINTAKAQQAYRMKLLSQYNDTLLPTVDGGDIWNDLIGWFDPIKNREYIVAGSIDSVYFFDVTDPLNMKLIDRELGTLRWTRNRDFETYQKLFDSLSQTIKPPDLLIYLRASIPSLVNNIQKRGREYEDSIRLDYLRRLNERYEAWISSYKPKHLIIEIDELNFAENSEHLGSIISKIQAEVNGLF